MLELINPLQNYTAKFYTGYDKNQQHQLTCVIKSGWRFDLNGQLTNLTPPPEIEEIDRYFGEPGKSSLIAAHEVMPYKNGSEIIIYGTAQPPSPTSTAAEVSITIHSPNKTWQKKLKIFGPRKWQSILVGQIPGKPQLLQPLPLRYEYAYGGQDPKTQSYSPANPAGVGFTTSAIGRDLSLPQIEDIHFISKISDRPHPAGFGPIPVAWQLAGKKSLKPIAPSNMAPLDQQFQQPFIGNEKITLCGFVNIPSYQIITFNLPTIKPQLQLSLDNNKTMLAPICDTVEINADTMTLNLTWRIGIPWRVNDQRRGTVLLQELI